MPPHNLHCVFEIPSQSGIAADSFDFAFQFQTASAPTSADLNAIQAALETFWNTPYGSPSHAVANFLNTQVSRTVQPTLKTYDKTGFESGLPSGGPIDVRPTALLASRTGGTVDLPNEVAVVLTFNSDYGTVPEFGPGHTRLRSRHRGRVFIGPLTSLAFDAQTITGPIVSAAIISTLSGAGHGLVIDSGTVWCQWSRKDAVFRPVIGGSVDNAPDTQRRRGLAPTARTIWV